MFKENKSEDAALVKRAQSGDLEAQEALIVKYMWLARSKARNYFLEGGTQDDLMQEGLLGLWKAIKDYDETKNDSFMSFASMCIVSRITDTLRTQTRQKNKTLNEAVSLSELGDSCVKDYGNDPISDYIVRDGTESFYEIIEQICTEEQIKVLKLYLEGYTYAEIASMTGLSSKKVDNVLLAIKKKIKQNKELFAQ